MQQMQVGQVSLRTELSDRRGRLASGRDRQGCRGAGAPFRDPGSWCFS